MAQPPQLAPMMAPLAIFPNYIAQRSETIIMQEKVLSLSDDSFYVRTTEGADILSIRADALSLSQRKNVYAADGTTHLFTIRHELLKLPRSFFAEDPAGNVLFRVVGKWSILASKAECHFTNALTGQPESLAMNGNFSNRHTVITDLKSGAAVAEINRDFLNARQLLGGRQSYAVTVAPGVDIALIVAMCVCLDEKADAKRGGHRSSLTSMIF